MTITLSIILTVLSTSVSAASSSLPPYTNHTVGDRTGWFFNSNKNSSVTDYSKWAKSQSFYLGDFLIFKTDTNTSVVHTYNKTTYALCTVSEDDTDGETFIYTPTQTPTPITNSSAPAASIEVPLTQEGTNYFFSAAQDGIQCSKGMKFDILVAKGRGLPPSLNQPPPPFVERVVPPPPDTVIGVNGGTPQGEEFYTGGAVTTSGKGIGLFFGSLLLLFVM